MQRYGLILADIGSSWFLTGEASTEWEEEDLFGPMESQRRDDVLGELNLITGDQMEVVNIDGEGLALDEFLF
jgi:hypothetical protein